MTDEDRWYWHRKDIGDGFVEITLRVPAAQDRAEELFTGPIARRRAMRYVLSGAVGFARLVGLNVEPILLSVHNQLDDGVCKRCGCTTMRACDGGCSWVDAEHTLCSACRD